MFARHSPTNSLLFLAEDPFEIRSHVPESQTLPHAKFNIAVKHTLDNIRVLRNLGYDAPLPPYDYPGKHQALDHQKVMVDFYCTHERGFNLSEMGAMKTAPTCWAADFLMKNDVIKRAAILCPLSTMNLVWMQEIFDTVMHRHGVAVHGGPEKRAKALTADCDFYVINHHGIRTREVKRALKTRKDIQLIVVDEGSIFRNARTDLYKALEEVLRPWHRLWWITGAPTPNYPTDAWAQARIINPNSVPKFFGTFKQETMHQVSQFKWVPKSGAAEKVFKALQPAVRFKRSECIQLPPVTTIPFQTAMSSEQSKLFKEMKAKMKMEIELKASISAVNAADQINKLRQLLCGCVKDTKTEDYHVVDFTPRLDTLCEIIEQASAKVLVIVPFKGILDPLAHALRKRGPKNDKYTVDIVNGDVSPGRRERIFQRFKRGTDLDILLCHPKVMAHGLNLTEADTMAFYAPIYSNDDYGQVIERINRSGQTLKMTIARIAAHPLEWQIYRMVDTRRINQEGILDLFKTAITEYNAEEYIPEMT
jgi:SNF2 family DNA or RNA helicase